MDTISKILELIEEKGITKSYICLKLGLANNYLAEVKKGKAKLSDERIALIADILGTTSAYLKGEQEDFTINTTINLDNLFLRMDALGVKAVNITEATGISSGNISDWKSGRSMPSAIKLDALATYLDCSVDYLLGRTDNPAVNRSPLDAARSPIRLAAYDGSDDQPAYTTKEQLDAAPDLEL